MSGGRPYSSSVRRIDPVPLRASAQGAPAKARDGQRVVKASAPIPVWVWLVLPDRGDFLAKGEALWWTEDQVGVRYIDFHGREGFVAVWANAVRRR